MTAGDLWLEGWINQERRERGLPLVHQSYAHLQKYRQLLREAGLRHSFAEIVGIPAKPKPLKYMSFGARTAAQRREDRRNGS